LLFLSLLGEDIFLIHRTKSTLGFKDKRLGSEWKNHMSENLGGPRAVDKSMAKNLNISNWSDVGGLAKSD
ncbi:unnamed protein product, partial [Bubo scandiacus]